MDKSLFHFSLYMAGVTDTGHKREHNEDYLAWDDDHGLAILADGMGGHNAGDVASRLCVMSLQENLLQALDEEGAPPSAEPEAMSHYASLVQESMEKANALIYETAEKDPTCKGMGTTVVLVLFYDGKAVVAHVGDSRVYRLHKNHLEAVTADHSLVRELLAQGTISPEEAEENPFAHVITRAVGVRPEVEAEIQELDVAAGDVFLLCSDGLTDMVEDAAIEETLKATQGNWQRAAQRLVDLANQAGGKDNISVLIAAVGPKP
jgi:serine/threonine protein phosphatase PrpC